jgi:hypothetical protein
MIPAGFEDGIGVVDVGPLEDHQAVGASVTAAVVPASVLVGDLSGRGRAWVRPPRS